MLRSSARLLLLVLLLAAACAPPPDAPVSHPAAQEALFAPAQLTLGIPNTSLSVGYGQSFDVPVLLTFDNYTDSIGSVQAAVSWNAGWLRYDGMTLADSARVHSWALFTGLPGTGTLSFAMFTSGDGAFVDTQLATLHFTALVGGVTNYLTFSPEVVGNVSGQNITAQFPARDFMINVLVADFANTPGGSPPGSAVVPGKGKRKG